MEQRQHPRFPVQFQSSFRSANLVSGEGTLVDLSIRGCRIVSVSTVKPGTTLNVRIDVSSHAPSIHVQEAVVRWCRDGTFGLEFVSLIPEEWAQLQRLVKELGTPPSARKPW